MPDIKKLGILTINWNTIGTKELDKADKQRTKTANNQESMHQQQSVNIRQEADTPEKCYTNTDSTSKFENKNRPTVTANDNISYFLPGP